MKIKMIATAKGADDGFTVRTYTDGEVYPQDGCPCGADLAQAFVAGGMAVDAEAAENIDASSAQIAQETQSDVGGDITTQDPKPAPKARQSRKRG